jgi:hypothetical protein
MMYFTIFLSSMIMAGIMTYAAVVLYDHFPEKEKEKDVEPKKKD